MKPIPPSRQKFVNVSLMTDVKKKVIRRCVKNPMQRNGQLHHPEVGPQMAAGFAEDADQFLPDLLRQLREFFQRNFLNVGRAFDLVEKRSRHGKLVR